MLQQLAWMITIVLVAMLGLVFLIISRKAGRRMDYQPIQEKWYRIRKIWFISLVSVMVLATVLSLSRLPYDQPTEAASSVKEVDVKGYQFYWEMSQEEFIVGEPIQFNVTSMDVTHGFGIYDENFQLLAQTQAMPGYTNKVHYTFEKPGTYQILCLEYCSVGHHQMIKKIVVKPKNGGSEHGGK